MHTYCTFNYYIPSVVLNTVPYHRPQKMSASISQKKCSLTGYLRDDLYMIEVMLNKRKMSKMTRFVSKSSN